MIIVFLGPPGAGKGTQCKVLVERYRMNHLSSGDCLRRERQNNTELGQKAQSYMDNGQLVPDELIVAMMMKEIEKTGVGAGVVLDGFPRTVGQAHELDRLLERTGKTIDVVINLQIDDNELEIRITGRRSCPDCGAAYHIVFNMPHQENICDNCGQTLTQRSDDTAEVVKNRIATYHRQTAPLIDFYQQKNILKSLDGNAAIEKITANLCRLMDEMISV